MDCTHQLLWTARQGPSKQPSDCAAGGSCCSRAATTRRPARWRCTWTARTWTSRLVECKSNMLLWLVTRFFLVLNPSPSVCLQEPGWTLRADFTITLVHQDDESKSIRKSASPPLCGRCASLNTEHHLLTLSSHGGSVWLLFRTFELRVQCNIAIMKGTVVGVHRIRLLSQMCRSRLAPLPPVGGGLGLLGLPVAERAAAAGRRLAAG